MHLATGLGVTKDYAKAMDLYRKAAAHGHPRAMSSIGVMFMMGEGVTPDYKQAVSWFRKAAEAGFHEGCFNLGVAYLKGLGVPKDMAQAYYWFQLARGGGYRIDSRVISNLESEISPKEVNETLKQVRDWQANHVYWTDWLEVLKYGWWGFNTGDTSQS